jgi:hypothetical protein
MDKTTGQQVAIKFIERGDKVCMCTRTHAASWDRSGSTAPSLPYCCRRLSVTTQLLATESIACGDHPASLRLQVTKYVEREIQNHRTLMHPHIVQFKEVSCKSGRWRDLCIITFH